MKRFLVKTFFVSLPFILLMVGEILYYAVCVKPYITRDLSRLGMIAFPVDYSVQCSKGITNRIDTPIDSLLPTDADSVVWILGDSFSRSKEGYVNYLSIDSVVQYIVVTNQNSPFQAFVSMCNANYQMPRYIVLEMVERYLADNLSNIDFSCNKLPIQVNRETKRSDKLLGQAHECLKLRIGIENTPVRKVLLSRPLFSCMNKETALFFYYHDLNQPSSTHLEGAVENLKKIFSLAEEKGIDLYVLIAADKYEIYRSYIVDNPYEESEWLNSFVSNVGNPRLINSANILDIMVKKGVKDIYYCDDTHWSPIGSKAVAEYFSAKVNALNKKN